MRDAWIEDVPPKLRELLREIDALMKAGLFRLVPAGLRTLIELTGRELLGDARRTNPGTLDELHRQGIIGAVDREVLGHVLAAANAAVHEGKELPAEAIRHMMLCVERLLQAAFTLRRPQPLLAEVVARRRGSQK